MSTSLETATATVPPTEPVDLPAAIAAEFENRPPKEKATIASNFINAIALLDEGRRRFPRMTQPTLVKVYELNLLWAIQTRGSAPDQFTGEESGEFAEPEGIPEGLADEILGADGDEPEATDSTPESE